MPTVWLVTGSSSGFGLRLVSSIIQRGDRVIATARSLDKLKSNLEDIVDNPNCHIVQLDITWEPEQIRSAIDKALDVWGRIDVLVNNAGVGYKSLIEEARPQVSFHASIPILSLTNPPALYASSKAALRVYGETLTTELIPFNIRVLIVEPGAFRTEGILSQKYHTTHPITDYDDTRAKCIKIFNETEGKQPGDPDKAVELLVDVVRGDRGEELPGTGYLPLGADAVSDVKQKCEKMIRAVDIWCDEASKLGFDS